MRFFVMNGEAERAVEMLKKTLEGSPIPVVGSPGEHRYLRLPNAAVCNKVLHLAATRGNRDERLLDDLKKLVFELSSRSVRIYPRTLLALYQGYTQSGKSTQARDIVVTHVKESPPDIGADVFSGLLEQQSMCKDRKGLVDAINLMGECHYCPSPSDCLDSILRMYVHGDELRHARAFLSWMWFNHAYCTKKKREGVVWSHEKPSDTLLGGHVLASRSLVLMEDMKPLKRVPGNISATAVGLCAIDRNYDAGLECLSRSRGHDVEGGRHLVLSLLHLYTRTQRSNKLVDLIQHALDLDILPEEALLKPIVLDADSNPDFCESILLDLRRRGVHWSLLDVAFLTMAGRPLQS